MEHKAVVIGITGQTGAGKSTVSGLLRDHGFCVIDADVVARQVVEKGGQCLLELTLEFGTGILDASGALNRRRLGNIVFDDRQKRSRLGQITFPHIQKEIRARIARFAADGGRVIFLDAPTLLESGSDSFCDQVVSVLAPVELRLRRLLERDAQYTRRELENRISAQYADEYYTARSDFVIQNQGDFPSLRVQVMEMLEHCCPGVGLPQPKGSADESGQAPTR